MLGPVDNNAEGDEGGSEFGEGEEVASGLFVTGGDATIVLQTTEKTLDDVAPFVRFSADFSPMAPMA